MKYIAGSALIAIISVPLLLGLVPPNGVYGFRTTLTRSNPDIWYPVNTFAGWTLLLAALIAGVALVMLPLTARRWMIWVTFLVPILSAVGVSFLYLQRFA